MLLHAPDLADVIKVFSQGARSVQVGRGERVLVYDVADAIRNQ
jgi:hypothetical protein